MIYLKICTLVISNQNSQLGAILALLAKAIIKTVGIIVQEHIKVLLIIMRDSHLIGLIITTIRTITDLLGVGKLELIIMQMAALASTSSHGSKGRWALYQMHLILLGKIINMLRWASTNEAKPRLLTKKLPAALKTYQLQTLQIPLKQLRLLSINLPYNKNPASKTQQRLQSPIQLSNQIISHRQWVFKTSWVRIWYH